MSERLIYVCKNNFLNTAEFIESPNFSPSKTLEPENIKFIIIHYTSGPSLDSAVNWFQRPVAKASAHLIIDDSPLLYAGDTPAKSVISAKVVQMVPFDRKAWHAGRSEWDGAEGRHYVGLNSNSIGIELVNPGQLTKTSLGDWITWYGDVFKDIDPPPSTDLLYPVTPLSIHEVIESEVASHTGWASYPRHQIECLQDVINALMDAFPIVDILGHSDIAPMRKIDPGPAFPMHQIRSMFIEGRRA